MIVRKYDAHTNLVQGWKGQLMLGPAGVFDKGAKRPKPEDNTTVKVHTKTGRFTMKIDSLEHSDYGANRPLSSQTIV